jgi:uncharacterized membrane protein
MVLELHPPHEATFAALAELAPVFLAYLLSFIYVGIYWNNHHHMFQLARRVTGGVMWANLGLLFCLSLLPFSTAWTDETDYARTPVITYGVNLLLAAVAYFILQKVIIHGQGPESPLRQAIGRDLKGKLSPMFYFAGILFAQFAGGLGIVLAIACYVVVALLWIVPDRRIDRAVRDFGSPD